MTQARRMNGQSEEIAALRQEVRSLRAAISGADDFEAMVDRVDERDPMMPGLTLSEVKHFTVEECIEHKDAIDALLTAGPDPAPPDDGDLPPAARRPTGMQPLNEHSAGPERAPLSRASLAAMSHEEIIGRKPEIDQWLARGGANR